MASKEGEKFVKDHEGDDWFLLSESQAVVQGAGGNRIVVRPPQIVVGVRTGGTIVEISRESWDEVNAAVAEYERNREQLAAEPVELTDEQIAAEVAATRESLISASAKDVLGDQL